MTLVNICFGKSTLLIRETWNVMVARRRRTGTQECKELLPVRLFHKNAEALDVFREKNISCELNLKYMKCLLYQRDCFI